MTDVSYKRNLPHIHPEGYPLFITFCLADSIPLEVLAELKAQRERKLNSAPGLSPSERYNIEKRYFGQYDNWLDRCEHGPHWLGDEIIAKIVMDNVIAFDKDRYDLYACCIMPNHGHILIEPSKVKQANHKGKSAKYPVIETLRL